MSEESTGSITWKGVVAGLTITLLLLAAVGIGMYFAKLSEQSSKTGEYSLQLNFEGLDQFSEEWQERIRQDLTTAAHNAGFSLSSSEKAHSHITVAFHDVKEPIFSVSARGMVMTYAVGAEKIMHHELSSEEQFVSFLQVVREELLTPALSDAFSKGRGYKGRVLIGSAGAATDHQVFLEVQRKVQALKFETITRKDDQPLASRDDYSRDDYQYHVQYVVWSSPDGTRNVRLFGYLPGKPVGIIFQVPPARGVDVIAPQVAEALKLE